MDKIDKLTEDEKRLILSSNQQDITDVHLQHALVKRQIVEKFMQGKSRKMIMDELKLGRKKQEALMIVIRKDIIAELKSEDQVDNLLTRFEGLYAAALSLGNLDLCFKILRELSAMKRVSVSGQLMVQWEWNLIDEAKNNNVSEDE